MRKRIYEIVERSRPGDKVSRAYDIYIVIVACISLVPLMFKEQTGLLSLIDIVTVYLLFLDYILRWMTYDYKVGKVGTATWKTFARYPFTPFAIIDLLAILPSLGLLPPAFMFFRVLRVVKILRYSKNLMIVGNVFAAERKTLLSVLVVAIAYIFVSGLVMFVYEPDTFEGFFHALYWATTALTTVGYGDVSPLTDLGRFISMVSSLFGIAVIALPAGIITGGYLEEVRKSQENKATYFHAPDLGRYHGKPLGAYAGVREYARAHPKVVYYLAIMAVGVALDIGLYAAAAWLGLPLWLDTTGTALVAFLLEPAAALLVGFVNNLYLSIVFQNAGNLLYFALSAIVAIVYGTLLKRGKKLTKRSIGLSLLFLVAVSAAISTGLTYSFDAGVPTTAGPLDYWGTLLGWGIPAPAACFLALAFDRLLDTVAVFVVVTGLGRLIAPRAFAEDALRCASASGLNTTTSEGGEAMEATETIEATADAPERLGAAEPVVLGIDVGGTSTKVGVFTCAGTLVARHAFPTVPVRDDGSFPVLAEGYRALIDAAGVHDADVAAIGLAVPGMIAAEESLKLCPNVDLDLRAYKAFLHGRFPRAQVVVLNDADAAVLGDRWKGSAHEHDASTFVLVTLGTGLGAGVVVRGGLVTSANGAVGEIGHLCVDPTSSVMCGCGRTGCLEQYASGSALVRMAREFAEPGSVPPETAQEVFEAAKAGDAAAGKAVDVFADKLGFGLAQMACMVDPELFVIGGGLSGSAESFIRATREAYKGYALEVCRATLIVVSSLGNECGMYGAACRALEASQH